MSVLLQDVRYALRSLTRTPGFTLVALVTLALGIGGTTAIFSVVDGILLRPLPYPTPDAIVSLMRVNSTSAGDPSFAPADFLDHKRGSRSFSALAGFRQQIVDLATRGGEPVRLTALETTAAFFDVFALPPLMGRVYSERTDASGGARLAVISEGLWRQHLGAAPNVVGQALRLNDTTFTVIGVMPGPFVHPSRVDLWILSEREVPSSPIPIDGDPRASREVQYFTAMGRLIPGTTIPQANEDLRAISDRLGREFPDTNANERVEVREYHEQLVGGVRTALLMLLGAVAFVLLIACSNVASLLLARGTARRREFALRSALGAGRGRLVRQLLTESLLLASLGGIAGLLLAYWGVAGLLAIAPTSIPRLADVRIDPRVAAFAVTATGLVGLLFGLVPALQGARAEVVEALKDGGRTGTARAGAQKALVVAEVALALVLLIGAGLMLTSFARLRAVDVGFDVRNLIVVFAPLPQGRYDGDAQAAFYTQLLERLHANPITARSAIVYPTPFGGGTASGGYAVEGRPATARPDQPLADINSVTPGYFQTMGIPILRGRDVSPGDTKGRPQITLINRTLAEREWPGEDPIGKRISIGGDPDDADSWMTIVGVVGDTKQSALDAPVRPAVFLSHHRFAIPFSGVVVRSDLGEAAVAGAVHDAVRAIDPALPAGNAESVDRLLQRRTGQPRFRAVLISAFAAVALVLAAVGLYGLISYTVSQRVAEIGVRLALGATPAQVGRLVVGQGLTLVAVGVGSGIVLALAATRLIENLLFSVSATDPVVYSGLAVLLLAIAALACYVPARRAMKVDPITALRAE